MVNFLVAPLRNLLKQKISAAHRRTIGGAIRRSIQQQTFHFVRKIGLKVITRKEVLESNIEHRVFQFNAEEAIDINHPCNGSDQIREILNTTGQHRLAQPFVIEVENAKLVGAIAIGFDATGNIISETISGNPDCIKYIPAQTLLLEKLSNWAAPQIEAACSLTNWNSGYFHWLIDCLTRLEGIEYYQAQTGIKPTLIIHANPQEWQKESLRLLGYNPDDYIEWNDSSIKVKKLIVPSFRREHNIISPTACQWLRQRLLSNLPDNTSISLSPRIYISRPKSAGRNIINEDDVMAVLAPLGFVAYTMEELSFVDEIRLFSQAEIVIAPHGAGLTNIIFASQKLIVIDLFGSFGTPCFFALAQALGFYYGCLGEGFDPKNKTGKYKGITVDIAKLQVLLQEILNVRDRDRQVASVEEALLPTGDNSTN
ncbi:glycosyltransferase family 61 protein [Scytonema millei]|uniref:Glycosyltransferase family 61 protein n=1 Tax=Scytonema millei VB511283 TaxID=1245923 RepID=A0A9X5E4B1_9CYAN|nr:glycosyltransferase family 61 protein [Scytonema millei]NHC33919.1 glycosyltransferase family 61 protein [Scytonema millei VB511283]